MYKAEVTLPKQGILQLHNTNTSLQFTGKPRR